MNLNEIKNEIHERSKYYLEKDKSGKGYICPICGSGTGKNGTGITTKDNIHFTCWKGCYTSTDIIDIIGMQYGLNEYKDKIEKACDLMGIIIKRTMPQNAQKCPKTSLKQIIILFIVYA